MEQMKKMKFLIPLVSLLLSKSCAFVSNSKNFDIGRSVLSMSDTASEADTKALEDLKTLQEKSNPLTSYWDPLNLASSNFWDQSDSATIGFLRQAEIKHGRVAMAAFVGYCVQSNWHFPWKQTLAGDDFPSIDLSPEAQWDSIPLNAKLQIVFIIGLLEIWDEVGGNFGDSNEVKHYMRGGQPGKYPSFDNFSKTIHPVLNLYDPFGFSLKMSAEKKEERLIKELNNGRLAMIGIFGFLVADAIPGSVPLLESIAKSYEGNIMVPFSSDFSFTADGAPNEIGWVVSISAVAVILKNREEEEEIIAEVAPVEAVVETSIPESDETETESKPEEAKSKADGLEEKTTSKPEETQPESSADSEKVVELQK